MGVLGPRGHYTWPNRGHGPARPGRCRARAFDIRARADDLTHSSSRALPRRSLALPAACRAGGCAPRTRDSGDRERLGGEEGDTMTEPSQTDLFAAVDLGSNSFHMVLARCDGPDLIVIDRLREMVRLAAGLDADRYLSAVAQERALACLERFGQRLADLPASNIRAVGTSALRQARNAEQFIAAAEAALDHGIEIVSGMEEARLIYLGVAHSLAPDGRRLVIDIGGGSTEFIVGEATEPLHKASLHMGCVGHSQDHFADGRISRKRFERAELAARLQIEPIEQRFRSLAWREAIGSSGTIKAAGAAIRAAGWNRDRITADGLARLRQRLIDFGHVDAIDLDAIKPERRAVFAGGVAILKAAFDALGIDAMRISEGAMREGLLHDLPGRIEHADIRDASVERLAERFHVEHDHAERVRATAEHLLGQVRRDWGLDREAGWLLRWAALLHEIGMDIGYSAYHKHGAYIIANTDLAGFSQGEQERLAALVRLQRRKFGQSALTGFDGDEARLVARLAILLRIAVVVHRGRAPLTLPRIDIAASGARVQLAFGDRWLARHALVAADLAEEGRLLRAAGFDLAAADATAPAAH